MSLTENGGDTTKKNLGVPVSNSDANPLDITVRGERPEDFPAIRRLVAEAFATAAHSDGDEHNLVDRLRNSPEYLPGLSLVAVSHGDIIGYVMFSKILIGTRPAVAPAPLAVAAAYRHDGIGTSLMDMGHKAAQGMGYPCSVILGVPEYYGKFGYRTARQFGIVAPFEVEEKYFMALQLAGEEMPWGTVVYSKAFGL